MKQRVIFLIQHPLITGSSIVLAGSFGANIVNYLFNLFLGRSFIASDYGLIASLSSFFILLSIFQISFSNVISKLTAEFFVKNENEGIKVLFALGFRYLLIFSGVLLVLLLVLLDPLASFLHVENKLFLVLMFFTIFFSLLASLPGGILLGEMRFFSMSVLTVIQPVIKFVTALILIFVGLKVFGAVASFFTAALVGTVLGYMYYAKLHGMRVNVPEKIPAKLKTEFFNYSKYFFLSSIGITLLQNTDIILTRHFLSPTLSGQYAALSLMGKAIFYLTTPINSVFFPLIAQKYARKERLFNTVILAMGIISIASISLSFIYFTFPNLVLNVFFPGLEYRVLSSYLGIYSLYIFMFSLSMLLNNFFLSIGKTRVFIFTLLAAIAQIAGIVIFHNSLYQIIGVLFVTSLMLFTSMLLYYIKYGKD